MKKLFTFKTKKEMYRAAACLFVIMLFVVLFWRVPLLAKADNVTAKIVSQVPQQNNYNSWVQGQSYYNDIYGAVINGLLGGSIFPSSGGTEQVFNVGHIDLTLDSVIFGRLLEGGRHSVNFVSWELNNGNVYGVISSFIYRLFWDIAFSVFVFALLIMLIRSLVTSGDSKKRAELKDGLGQAALVFLMLYLVPHIADMCVYLRDWLLRTVYFMMSGDNNIANLSYEQIFLAQWWTWPDVTGKNSTGVGGLAMGVLFFAASCAGLIFAIDYIRIAIKQTALFAFFPVFAILSLKNKKILSNWLVEFLPNIFIPVIDCVLLLLPTMLIRVANTQGLRGLYGIWGNSVLSSGELDVGVFLICCIMIFSVIPMRKEILKLIGQAAPMGGSRGFGGVMAAGMMAMRMMGRGGSGISSGIENYGGLSAGDNMAIASALESSGSAGATMSSVAAINANNANETFDMVSDISKGAEEAGGSIEDGAAAFGGALDEGMEGGSGLSASDMADSGYSISPGEDGYDMQIDGYSPDIPEEMDGLSADIPTAEAYQSGVYEPLRDENLERIGEIDKQIKALEADNFQLSAENSNDAHLLQQYDNLNRDMDYMNAGGIKDVDGRPLSPQMQNIEADQKNIMDGMKRSVEDFRPYAEAPSAEHPNGISPQAGKGAPLNYGDTRERIQSSTDPTDYAGRVKENMAQRKSMMDDNRAKINELKAERGARVQKENMFAQESKAYGGSGKTFDSAEAYRKQREVDSVYKKLATYKNFDTKEFSEHLDPATRAKLYRDRAMKQIEAESKARRQKVITAAGVGAGAVIGGSAMMFGGEQAAMNGAMMGGMMGGVGANKASGIASANAARKEELQKRNDYGKNQHMSKATIHKTTSPRIDDVRKLPSSSGSHTSSSVKYAPVRRAPENKPTQSTKMQQDMQNKKNEMSERISRKDQYKDNKDN